MAIALLAAVFAPCVGQPIDTIRANPEAVRLREIWRKYGESQVAYLKLPISLGDVSGDSIGDFVLSRSNPRQAQLYLGDTGTISKIPARVFPDRYAWTSGDFWGTGRPGVLMIEPHSDSLYRFYRIGIHRTDSGWIDSLPSLSWWTGGPDVPGEYVFLDSDSELPICAADLDLDGDDELIAVVTMRLGPNGTSTRPETMIFEGGADFDLVPEVVLIDEQSTTYNNSVKLFVGRIDSDAYPDILTNYEHVSPSQKRMTHIYFGTGRIPEPGTLPARSIVNWLHVWKTLDVDGDSVLDVFGTGPLHVFLSRSADARSRSFEREDADRIFVRPGTYFGPESRIESINRIDKAMNAFGAQASGGRETVTMLFSADIPGVDLTYEAYASDRNGEIGEAKQLDDANGDGWTDIISSMSISSGVAVIHAGGPYIPYDSLPPSAIRTIALEHRARAVALWPNPARDQVNIAWRGDLERMPAAFRAYDAVGRLVARGEVDAGAGAALWRCGGQAPGRYRLVLLDGERQVLASVPVAVIR